MFQYIKKFFNALHRSSGHNILLSNAVKGWPNSQYELAVFYLTEKKDFVEAYAWAEVACIRNIPNAYNIKKLAEDQLNPNQIKEAWETARRYKDYFIP